MRYPPFLQSLIKDPSVHRKLEKQSGAVILFSSPGKKPKLVQAFKNLTNWKTPAFANHRPSFVYTES